MTKSASIKNRCAYKIGWAMALLATSALALPAQAQETDAEDVIIVTATKRAEKLTEVPIAISVMGAEDIDQTGIRELSEISAYIPNVQISDGTDFRSVITIRGVGSSSRNIGFDSRVGVYVDGVYMGQSPSVNQELLDLERVEVLRGPQGMLFGKNTVAGAISLVTVKPSQDFYGQLSADLGNYNYREFKGMVNMPLGEKAAVKFAISKTDRDGYVDNITTGSKLAGKDVLAYRAQLRLTPTENFEANFAFDYLKSDNLALLGEPLSDFLGIAPITIAPAPRQVAFNIDPRDNRNVKGGMADLQYELQNGFTLKSITGYRDTRGFTQNATDYSPIDIFSIEYTDAFKQFTQEFQFISPDNQKLTYMAGLYYYHQKAKTIRDGIIGFDFYEGFLAPIVAPAFGFNPATVTQGQLAFIANFVGFGPEGSLIFNRGNVTTESYAGYVNGSYDFNDRLTLGFGGRYSVEDKKVSWLLDGTNSGLFNIGSTGIDPTDPNPPAPSPLLNKRQDKFFSPAISLSYAVSDDANMYAKYSSGYKSGGFNLDFINANELAANNGLEFGKETVDSYELGFKGNFVDGRFKLNLAAFLADYNNYQVNQFVDLGGGRTSIRITNAAQVRTQGIEAEMQLEVTDNLHLQGSLGLLDAKFDKFPGGGTAGADVTGNKLPSAPEFTASFSATYTHNLPALNSMLLVRGDLTHSGGYFTTVNNVKSTPLLGGASVPFGYISKLTQLNGRIGIIPNNEKFSVFLWGRNLTNADGLNDTFRDFFGTITNKPIIGRTYGIGLTANF